MFISISRGRIPICSYCKMYTDQSCTMEPAGIGTMTVYIKGCVVDSA